jgi:hypothetical protein
VTVSNNTTTQFGGGVYNLSASLTIVASTLAGNTAKYAGGIANYATLPGYVALTDSTLSGNTATIDGGGITNSGTASVVNTTIADNASASAGDLGGLSNNGTLQLKNTIIAGSASFANCGGPTPVTSQGHNLSSDGTCSGLTQPGDQINTDPKLGPLQDNGGGTQTHALLPYSPAINAGDNTGCPSADQRGVARPQGTACDIGAYEFQPPAIGLSPPALALQVGASGLLTVTLGAAQATDTTIALHSSNAGAATVPASVVIPAPQLGASFAVTAGGAGASTITATLPQGLGGTSATAGVTVSNPPTATRP